MIGAAISRAAGGLMEGSLVVYQWTLRPLLGPNCRFVPSCSDYARQAIMQHGTVTGLALAARRIGRCHPWCEGGLDPVPPPGHETGRRA